MAAVDATDCGIEGTVSCDRRDTRPPRAGAGAAVAVATSGSGVEGVAGAGEEAAAVFFMGIEGTGETARGPTGLVDDGPALAVLLALLAGTLAAGSLAGLVAG
ncbi:hypothetical protein APR49_21780 [Variovorax paradoxus]|nr:hypothetical protein APR49_21780 [Variovorax paradoxus]